MSDKREDKNYVANSVNSGLPQDIKRAGILRKLKTMKKKYFVLRSESKSGPARLEYYDNEKKYKAGGPAKRSILIKTCFNINRKIDAKHKLAIALYTKDDCFSVVADSENSRDEWLNAMLELQLDGPCMNGGAKIKPKYEHVWQVLVGDKSLASSRNMKGLYRLCLTPSALALIKVEQSDPPETLEFPLMSIRRCGHTHNYFVIELGRSSVTGAGELWLETEDVFIAQNMHEVTLNAMKSCREHEDLGPLARPRSASNSENSRPIATRRPVAIVSPQTISYGSIRDRCDSMPSRPRTISEGQEVGSRSYYPPSGTVLDTLRPYGGFGRTISYSPPGMPNPLSPVSATCSTDSAGSSLSIDDFDCCQQTDFAYGRYVHSLPTDGALHTEPPIKEEQPDEYMSMLGGSNVDDYLKMEPISSSMPSGPSIYLHSNIANSPQLSSSLTCGSDYMEMNSPTEGYINMSPICPMRELPVNKSSSSLDAMTESFLMKDGYIHMAPIRDQFSSSMSSGYHDGYLDMAPLSSSLPKTFSVISNHTLSISSRKDSNSKLSDTPVSTPSSTNLDEFPLDKVKSLLADTDDSSCESYIRPVRAYSMGSRPQPKKSHLPLHVDGSRIRAYSVGSQASMQKKNNAFERDREFGNLLRIDPRTGTKSSSAPLLNNRPPRVRSSTSRSEINEDLMEIDYNRVKYSTPAIDLSDSNFTIEPVGRSRSGSYSSTTNTAMKSIQEREKSKSHSGSNPRDDFPTSSDYLSMSPIANSHNSSSLLNNEVLSSKRSDYLHPPGDYVSLDPSCTYQNIENNTVSVIGSTSLSLQLERAQSPTSSAGNCPSDISSKSIDSSAPSDYMCMNYNSQSMTMQSASFHHSSLAPETEVDNKCHSLPTSASEPPSPQSKLPPSATLVPKTPPPSPSYGAVSNALSGAPLVENVVRRLSQPSGEIRLNYASLDLPPPSEDDGKMAGGRLRKSLEGETKETPLTYAQIDFSPVKNKVLQDSEGLSHL